MALPVAPSRVEEPVISTAGVVASAVRVEVDQRASLQPRPKSALTQQTSPSFDPYDIRPTHTGQQQQQQQEQAELQRIQNDIEAGKRALATGRLNNPRLAQLLQATQQLTHVK